MKGLCAPANQGNAEDGIWLQHKDWKKLQHIAATHDVCVQRARSYGLIIGIAIGVITGWYGHKLYWYLEAN